MEILAGLWATKVVAGLIGLVALLGVKKSDVFFTKPETRVVQDSIYVSTVLKNAFTEEIEKIILSGAYVNIRLKATFSGDRNNLSTEIVHCLKYDIATKDFLFIRFPYGISNPAGFPITQNDSTFSKVLKDIGKAKERMSKFNITVASGELSASSDNVTVVLRATIEPVQIEAMGGKEFELMCFWDYHTPTLKFTVYLPIGADRSGGVK